MTIVPKPREEFAPAINEKIKYEKVQLITHDGKNEGVVTREFALRLARENGLDLVIIADRGKDGFPVAKIADHGKLLYAKKKQIADAKKKQHVVQIKELKIRPKIGDHDFQTKINQAIDFLVHGKRVKFTLVFRGRENIMKAETGPLLFEKINRALEVSEVAKSLTRESDLQHENMWSRIYYLKK